MAGAAITWTDGLVALATYMNALPRGVMAYVNGSSSDQTGITTAVDITGLSATFTAISTRLYRTTVNVGLRQLTTATDVTISINDGASTVLRRRNITLAINGYGMLQPELLETGISGSITRKSQAFAGAASLTVLGASLHNCSLIVVDEGPA